MALRGKKPQKRNKRLKMLLFGEAGVGKSLAAIQMPCPYIIDIDGGLNHEQYTSVIERQDGVVADDIHSIDELINEVKELRKTKHNYKTLVIDSITVFEEELVDRIERSANAKDYMKGYRERQKKVKELKRLLEKLDMNVIITSQSKVNWIKEGKELISDGTKPNCDKDWAYFLDLMIEIEKDKKSGKRYAYARKTRLPDKFEEDKPFVWSFEELAKRYGMDDMTRESISIRPATDEQVIRMRELIKLSNAKEEWIDKKLANAQVNDWDEMEYDELQEIIDKLDEYVKSKNASYSI